MIVTELKTYIYKEKKIEYILGALGCKNIKYHEAKTNYWSASHKDGNNPQGININDNQYLNYCSWSRNVSWTDGQDLISLIEYSRQCDFITAIKWLHEILDLPYNSADIAKKATTLNLKDKALSIFTNHLCCSNSVNAYEINVLDESILEEYIPIEHIDFLHEGITPRTCKKFNIEYSYKRQRIIIPQRLWNTGQIIGYNARTTIKGFEELGVTKYSFNKGFNKSVNLYGLWENYDAIQRKGYVVIFESEKSVLKRHSQFDETGVALGGKFLSEEQKRILLGLNVDIIFALDKDIDINEIYNLCDKFYQVRNTYFVQDINNILDKKDSPADAPDVEYRKMINNKIKYTERQHQEYLKVISNE